MNNREYWSELSKRKSIRVMAILGVVVIIGLFITAIVAMVLGSEYWLGFLFLAGIVPIFIYVMFWLGSVIYDHKKLEELKMRIQEQNATASSDVPESTDMNEHSEEE